MNRRQYLLLVVLTVVAGLVGGAVSNRVFVAKIALAQEDTQEDKAVDRPFDLSKYLEGLTPLDKDKKQHEKVIIAQEFRLVDKDGKTLGRFGLSEVGGPRLVLSDENGLPRAMLSLSSGNPVLSLHGKDTDVSIAAGVLSEAPWMVLVDRDGTPRACLRLQPDGSPSLHLCDKGGKIRAALGTTDLEITQTGEARRRAASSLVLFDKDGKVMWSAP